MRRLYLEAVLRQPVEFFDASAPSSQATTFRVISTISDDADTIQDFLAEKVVAPPLIHPSLTQHLSIFLPSPVLRHYHTSQCSSCPTFWRT